MTIGVVITVLEGMHKYSDLSGQEDDAVCDALQILECFPRTMHVCEAEDILMRKSY